MADIAPGAGGGFQAIYDLFPDGPPTDEIARLGAEVAIKEASDLHGFVTIDHPNLFRVEMPNGTVIETRRQSRARWVLKLESAKTYNGKYLSLSRPSQISPGDDYTSRIQALIDLSNLGKDMTAVREIILKTIESDINTPLEELPASKVAIHRVIRLAKGGDNLEVNTVFDHYFGELNSNYKRTGSWKGDSTIAYLPHEFKIKSTALETPDDELIVLIGIGLMEYYNDLHRILFEEECELAKNNGNKVWWHITGGKQSIAKLTATLDKNSHFIVLNNPESVYMNIQHSEQKFVGGVVSKFNCKARHCDEPKWGTTLCGKKHAQLDAHEPRCNSCKRESANREREEMAPKINDEGTESTTAQEPVGNFATSRGKGGFRPKGTSPAEVQTTGSLKRQEEREWQSRNGDVITIQGPTQGLDPMDFQGLATEYRRVSDDLLERANYFSTLAEKYEALLKPSDAVREAQEALNQAQANEKSEREAQIQSLMSLISDGPPTA